MNIMWARKATDKDTKLFSPSSLRTRPAFLSARLRSSKVTVTVLPRAAIRAVRSVTTQANATLATVDKMVAAFHLPEEMRRRDVDFDAGDRGTGVELDTTVPKWLILHVKGDLLRHQAEARCRGGLSQWYHRGGRDRHGDRTIARGPPYGGR